MHMQWSELCVRARRFLEGANMLNRGGAVGEASRAFALGPRALPYSWWAYYYDLGKYVPMGSMSKFCPGALCTIAPPLTVMM